MKTLDAPTFSLLTQKKELLDFFDKNGFAIINDSPLQKDVTRIKEDINKVIRNQLVKHGFEINGNEIEKPFIEYCRGNDDLRRRFYDLIQDLPSLKHYSTQTYFQNFARELGVELPILRTSQIRMDIPKDERFLIPPHQEIRSIRSPNMVFFITPLCDTSPEMGGLQFAPGSHKLGPLMPETSEKESYQFIPEEKFIDKHPLNASNLKFGTTLLLNMYTIHGSGKNVSDKIRWSIITRYEDAFNMPFLSGDDSFVANYNLKGG